MHAMWKCGWLAVLGLGGAAWALQPGDTRLAVMAELGAPKGFIRAGQDETMYYERGSVQLRAGRVVDFELMSPEQLRQQREATARALADQAARMAALRAQLKTEGELVLQQLLTNAEFAAASPADQVARWREFMQRYPDVPVGAYYLPALKKLEAEQAQVTQDQRIADLERRVQAAEQQAMWNDGRKWQYSDSYDLGAVTYFPIQGFPLLAPPFCWPPRPMPVGPVRAAASPPPLRAYKSIGGPPH